MGRLHVRPLGDPNSLRVGISTGGGSNPRWSRDGRNELYYLRPDGTTMAVSFDDGGERVAVPGEKPLFLTRMTSEVTRDTTIAAPRLATRGQRPRGQAANIREALRFAEEARGEFSPRSRRPGG